MISTSPPTPPFSESAPPSTPPSPTAAADPAAAAAGTRIVLEIDGQRIDGHLSDNPTATSLVAQLPLTLTLSDFDGQEKEARLPAPLSLDGAPERSGAEPLTIGYYSPNQRLILYYDRVGSYAGIVPIGTFADLEAVRNAAGPITIQRAD